MKAWTLELVPFSIQTASSSDTTAGRRTQLAETPASHRKDANKCQPNRFLQPFPAAKHSFQQPCVNAFHTPVVLPAPSLEQTPRQSRLHWDPCPFQTLAAAPVSAQHCCWLHSLLCSWACKETNDRDAKIAAKHDVRCTPPDFWVSAFWACRKSPVSHQLSLLNPEFLKAANQKWNLTHTPLECCPETSLNRCVSHRNKGQWHTLTGTRDVADEHHCSSFQCCGKTQSSSEPSSLDESEPSIR